MKGMNDFFEIHKQELFSAVLIVVSVIVLQLLTKLFYNWSSKRKLKRFPSDDSSTLLLIKRVLNALWMVLGIIAFSFLFAERDKYAVLTDNFKLVLYLGFLAIATIVTAATSNMWFKRSIKKKILTGEDPTSYKFLRYVVVFCIYTIGILFGLLAFPSLRGVAQTALGGAGVIAIIAGVASQEALANLVGGLFIISFKPFKIGDIIKVTDTMVGTVVDITLRHTVIRNFENKMIVIPNAMINKEKLINYDLGESKCCERIEIGISYDSDIDLAKKIMQEECENHPFIIDNRSEEEKKNKTHVVKTAVVSLSDSSVVIRAWAWCKDFSDAFELRIDVLESIKKRFDKEGVEIPFPHRTIVMKKEKASSIEK
jgi:small-conductance mechanosensitive channel